MATYSYFCPTPWCPLDGQGAVVRDYAERLGLPIDQEFVEDEASWRLPLGERPAGLALILRLERGDAVVVASLYALAAPLADMASQLRGLQSRGVALHVADLARSGPQGRLTSSLEMLDYVQWSLRSLDVTRGMQRLRDQGRRRSRYAPIGYRFERRKGKTYQVPDEGELAVVQRIAGDAAG